MLYQELMKKYEELQTKYDNAILELNSLKKIVFGSRRETICKTENIESGEQISLFETSTEQIQENIENEIVEETEKIIVKRKKKSKKAGIKRSALKDIQFETVEHIIDENSKCPNCGDDLNILGKKLIRQEVEYVPAKLRVINFVQVTYKCVSCGTNESDNESPTFVKAKLPNPILTHSFASSSLITEIMYQKYFMGAPLYRQESFWEEKGLILPRNMMANWIIKTSEYYLEPLYNLMIKNLKSKCQLLHVDETTIQCNKEKDRDPKNKSYMWVMVSGELEKTKGVIFKYEASRSGETANNFLEGYTNDIMTDGYAGYNDSKCDNHFKCWAHNRRYFYESIPLDKNKKMITSSTGYTGVKYCDKLFKIEREIANLSVPKKIITRNELSKPIVNEFFDWVNKIKNETIVTNNKLLKALTYATNQKEGLMLFLEQGHAPLSNSLVERRIRPFAIHRKNWLFCDSVAGAKATQIMYSLVESAKLNNLHIWSYLKYLLDNLPQIENLQDETILEKFLPWSKELPKDILNIENPVADPLLKDKQHKILI